MSEAERHEVLERLRQRDTALTEEEIDELREVYPLVCDLYFDVAWKQAERHGVPYEDRGGVAWTAMAWLFKYLCKNGFAGNLAERVRSLTGGAISNHNRGALRRGVSVPLPSSGSEKARSSRPSGDRASVARELALRLLEQLSPVHKEIVRLIGVEQMSPEEAAIELDVPLGTVKSRWIRAQRALDKIAKQFMTESDRNSL
jgi:hypothetical protein